MTTPDPASWTPGAAAPPGGEPTCRVRLPRLLPRPGTREQFPLDVKLGERRFEARCPEAATWRFLVPFINFAGRLDLGTPGTPRHDAAVEAVGAFLVACFDRPARLSIARGFAAGQITDAQAMNALRLMLRLWWSEIDVAFEGQLL